LCAIWIATDYFPRYAESGFYLSDAFSSVIVLGDLDNDGNIDAFVVLGELGQDSGGEMPNEVWLKK
jgi:hypothetical protein